MNKLFITPQKWIKMMIPLFAILIIIGCGDDEDPPVSGNELAASFQFEIDANDFLKVNFTNFSQNATSYTWEFGDGNTSVDKDPSHTYSEAGNYTVLLTARNAAGEEKMRSENIILTDPNLALKLLTGETSKTWRLYREGISMSLGSDVDNPAIHWSGLENNGARPCMYEQEFIFHLDGTYEFDSKGMFWAEYGIFNNVENCDVVELSEQCFEPNSINMINACGDDISAWDSGTHSFEYNTATGSLTLTGNGAWIGIPKLGTTETTLTPSNTVTTKITIEQMNGFDLMLLEFVYAGEYWPIRYASYSDANLEPAVETEVQEFGEDLPDASPTTLGHSFAEAGTSTLDTIISGSGITFGVTDPAGGSDLVGEFDRTSVEYQELKFQTSPMKNDINFENLTTVSVEVYFPSSNDYTGMLTKSVIIGLADASKTEQWWTDHQQYELDGSGFAEDEWISITFNLDSPTFVALEGNGSTPYERNDYDMVFLNVGGSGHSNVGAFYVRNLRFE